MAERLGISSVKMIESGRSNMSLSMAKHIATTFHVPVDYIMRDPTHPDDPALLKFLESGMADDVTPDEIELLRRYEAPMGKQHTPKSYYAALQMIRAMAPDKK